MKSLDLARLGRVDTILFSARELREVLSAYSHGVLRKNWRDYAILTANHQTQFAVVERGSGDGARILFALTKTKPAKKDSIYKVFEGERPVYQGPSFLEALERFRQVE